MLATQFPVSATPSRLLGTPGGDLRFRIQTGEYHGRMLRIAASKCSIGSAPGCTLRLRGENIEPLHCLILTGKNGTIVRRNSPRTYLNGGPFEDATLQAGDILRIGPVELAVVDCPQRVGSSSPSQDAAPVDASHFEQAAAIEQRIVEEVRRAREEERREQQRLALELDHVNDQMSAVQEQLRIAQQIHEQTVVENQLAINQIRDQHAQAMERTLKQQREELSEGLAREYQFQLELCRAQQCAEELATRLTARQALADQQTADDQQTIVQLQQELRKERNQRRQERADDATIQIELESALTLLQADIETQRGQINCLQQGADTSAARIRELETQLDEARQLRQGQEHGLAEQQRLQEEFTAVRARLESSIAFLTEQLQKREAELATAHVRGGECADTLTQALDEARCEMRELQVQRSQAEAERTAFRMRLEEQLADLTTQLVERERELATQGVELTELRQKAAQLDASQQIVGQIQENLTAALSSHQVERESWLTERSELQRQQAELADKLSQGEAQRIALEEQSRSLETNRNDLQTQCQALEARCAALQNTHEQTAQNLEERLAAGATALQSEREAWQAERSQLESQRSELEYVRSRAESQFLELQNQHNDLQSRFANLEVQNNDLQTQITSLESRRSELETEMTLVQEATRHVEELEKELAELRGSRDEAVAFRLTEQAAKVEAIHNYEEQVERWQSEAHKWQLQAEELSGQVSPLRERCSHLEAQNAELQATIHAQISADSEQQNLELVREQLEIQGKNLDEARAQLREEQAHLANLREETTSREEALSRLETELREREIAWENARGEQAAALEERSQRIAAQIAQFEAEQAAFARQQATIIKQMSSLEDRVQELTKASESTPSNIALVTPQADDTAFFGDLESAEQIDDGQKSTGGSEDSMLKNAERPETRLKAFVAGASPLQSANELSADERDLVVRRLMLAVESNAGDRETLGSASLPAKKSVPEKTRYTPPSFLEQAAKMARQEDLAVATDQPVAHKVSSDSPPDNQDNESPSPASSEDDDESIEQYMNRLLSRVREGKPTAVSAFATPKYEPNSVAPSPNLATEAISENPAEPKEYVPRTFPPEPPERMSQMRELANSAAKSAIHAHAQKSQKREIKDRSLLALISLVGASSLFLAGCVTGSTMAYVGSMGFVTACCFMGLRALAVSYWQLRQKPLAAAAPNQGEDDCVSMSVEK